MSIRTDQPLITSVNIIKKPIICRIFFLDVSDDPCETNNGGCPSDEICEMLNSSSVKQGYKSSGRGGLSGRRPLDSAATLRLSSAQLGLDKHYTGVIINKEKNFFENPEERDLTV